MNTMGSNITWGLMLNVLSLPFVTPSWSSVTLDHFIFAWIFITTLVWITRSWIRSAS